MKTKQCEFAAMFRYTWPGRDESYACLEHAVALKNVAAAIGLHLQLIPINPLEMKTCQQQVSEHEHSWPPLPDEG